MKVISPSEFSAASLKPKGLSTFLYFSTKSSGSLKLKKSDMYYRPFKNGLSVKYSRVL
jgi:hypothetical protein